LGAQMTYEKFLEEFLSKGLLKRQKTDSRAVEKLLLRAYKDLKAAKANLEIDEGIAYTVAYLAMLHAARALILSKGFRPADGYQHKTVVEFTSFFLGNEFKLITEQFDRMRRKRNIFTYEIDISISKSEAIHALSTANRFVDLMKETIQKENPQTEFKFKG
jgi:uncharacterized protein (UPF0332 family)